MPSAEHQVTIARPPAEVFAFIADGLNAPRWRSHVLDIALISGSGASAVYKQGVRGPFGRRIDADYEISAYEPDRHLAFRVIAGPLRPTGEFRLDGADGGTRLTLFLKAELTGFRKLLMGGAVQKTMDAEAAATERLKHVLEAVGVG